MADLWPPLVGIATIGEVSTGVCVGLSAGIKELDTVAAGEVTAVAGVLFGDCFAGVDDGVLCGFVGVITLCGF